MKLNAYKETNPKINFLKIQKRVFIKDFICNNLRTLNVCENFENHEFVEQKFALYFYRYKSCKLYLQNVVNNAFLSYNKCKAVSENGT